MLTTATKRKIDTARDILVGKIPVPTSQVEQITLALVYKFMSDMDKKARELGDSSGFFANGYEKYAWGKLMDKALPARDRVLLYREALEKMSLNPHIPQLFRDVFRDASLPFNDPETLKLFLDVIDQFEYDHSEELGNAFEYLLQVMGSQGDAGQFRTPRHIIDFIVDVVEPSKTDKVLDPACGTAGFLISAYNQIKKNGLSSEEMTQLSENFVGYDISQDMQRLSLVNMYLHHFPNPHIYEYDSLTSEERWNDDFDVILANPPFMTPKGGIRPHNRFSVPSKRAEVLFVDYIMEHLTARGKAGVIVPEGIIFQSNNSYKQLRKMMVENNYLWAVVSLPGGVFNPYSGVKTSILLFDREIAQKTDKILFVKVNNDGFGLGAQRRESDKNDLPIAQKLLLKFKHAVQNGKELKLSDVLELGGGTSDKEMMSSYGFDLDANSHIELEQILSKAYSEVIKSEIRQNDFTLSSDSYIKSANATSSYPIYDFQEVCALEYGFSLPKQTRVNGIFPVVGSNGITGYHNEYKVEGPVIVVGRKGSVGEVNWIKQSCTPIDTTYYAKLVKPETTNFRYLYYILKSLDLPSLKNGAGIPGISRSDVYSKKKIPLPPLAIQQEIVEKLDGYQKIIDGARQVIENYEPWFEVDEKWETSSLGELCTLVRGSSPRPKGDPRYYGGDIPRLMVSDLTRDGMYVTPMKDFLTDEGAKLSRSMKKGDVVMAVSGNPGLPAILKIDASIHDGFVGFRNLDPRILPEFLYFVLFKNKKANNSKSVGAVFKNLTTDQVKNFSIPTPPLEIQKKIVSDLQSEIDAIQTNKKLIENFTRKISDKIESIWKSK